MVVARGRIADVTTALMNTDPQWNRTSNVVVALENSARGPQRRRSVFKKTGGGGRNARAGLRSRIERSRVGER